MLPLNKPGAVCPNCGEALDEYGLKPCRCKRYATAFPFRERLIRDGTILRIDPGKTFDSMTRFDPADAEFLRGYAIEFPSKQKGLFLYGEKGTGKTTAACCIANALEADRFASILLTPGMITEPRISENGAEEHKRLTRAAAFFPLVIIDDLGTERSSDYASEQMFGFVNARYSERLPIIITTNLTPEELESIANSDEARARVYQRLLELAPVRRVMLKDIRAKVTAEMVWEENPE